MESYRLLSAEAGGEDTIGHTMKDHPNFCHKLKMKKIDGGDANSVIEQLDQKLSDNPDFFYRVRLDEEGKICCIF